MILSGLLAFGQTLGLAQPPRLPNQPPQNAAQKHEVLTNQSIIKMVKAGLPADLIIAKIHESEANFDLSTDGLIALAQAGVPDEVIRAMRAKQSGSPITPAPPTRSNSAPEASPLGLPTEIGIYVKRKDQWVEVLPEPINWQTGGVLKSIATKSSATLGTVKGGVNDQIIATLGTVKGDVIGRILNPHSPNSVVTPVEFLIVTPEGVAVTEYQLLKLQEKKDAREFRMHASGGAKRDLLPFPQWTKIAPRTYLVTVQALSPGEYGFLPPGAYVSTSASAQLGKMYTFRVVEEH